VVWVLKYKGISPVCLLQTSGLTILWFLVTLQVVSKQCDRPSCWRHRQLTSLITPYTNHVILCHARFTEFLCVRYKSLLGKILSSSAPAGVARCKFE